MSPLGIGNDMGGSTRQPAINCGICGLRPSTGRVSRVMTTNAADIPMYYEQIACVNGPMARTVEDLQLALSVMQQPDPADPIWQPAALPTACAHENRVGLITQLPGDATAPAVSRALQSAAGTLRAAGYQVEEIEAPDLQTADDIIQRLALFEVKDYLDDILPMLGTDGRRFLTTVIGKEDVEGASYRSAIAERHNVACHWNKLLQQYPIIMGPVSTMEPFIVGADTGSAAGISRIVRSFRLTELCNLLGLPALALPVTLENGVPQGVQLIARRFDEARCFDAAKFIQKEAQITTPIEPDLLE
jgi:amidase